MDGPRGPLPAAPFPTDFYDRPVLAVARDLLGATVRHGPIAVRVTEVEAYAGLDDPASHAARGPTPRSAVMFGPPGRAYVYFIYGMHWCLNLVCGPAGTAAAVLIRAGEVVAGLEVARGRAPRLADRDLARGPGRLARVLAVHGGLTGSVVTGGGPVTVETGHPIAETAVSTGPRIGLRVARERPWRLWQTGDPTVSATPGARAARAVRAGSSATESPDATAIGGGSGKTAGRTASAEPPGGSVTPIERSAAGADGQDSASVA